MHTHSSLITAWTVSLFFGGSVPGTHQCSGAPPNFSRLTPGGAQGTLWDTGLEPGPAPPWYWAAAAGHSVGLSGRGAGAVRARGCCAFSRAQCVRVAVGRWARTRVTVLSVSQVSRPPSGSSLTPCGTSDLSSSGTRRRTTSAASVGVLGGSPAVLPLGAGLRFTLPPSPQMLPFGSFPTSCGIWRSRERSW